MTKYALSPFFTEPATELSVFKPFGYVAVWNADQMDILAMQTAIEQMQVSFLSGTDYSAGLSLNFTLTFPAILHIYIENQFGEKTSILVDKQSLEAKQYALIFDALSHDISDSDQLVVEAEALYSLHNQVFKKISL